jgi:hypothetical protein
MDIGIGLQRGKSECVGSQVYKETVTDPPNSAVFLEKLAVAHLLKQFHTFYRFLMFIAVFTIAFLL